MHDTIAVGIGITMHIIALGFLAWCIKKKGRTQ